MDEDIFEQHRKKLTALTKKTGKPAILVYGGGQHHVMPLDTFRPSPGQTIVLTKFPNKS